MEKVIELVNEHVACSYSLNDVVNFVSEIIKVFIQLFKTLREIE